MKRETQFEINSVEQLKEVYNHFKDKWSKFWDLEDEIYYFNKRKDFRYITCNEAGKIFLDEKHPDYKIIENPLKKELFKNCCYFELNENTGNKVFPKGFTDIQKALINLENEAYKLGFDVDVRINPKK